MAQNIISFYSLYKDGFHFSFNNNNNGEILDYKIGCFIFKASPCYGIVLFMLEDLIIKY